MSYILFKASSLRSVGNEQTNETASDVSEVLCWDDHPTGLAHKSFAPTHVRVGEDHSYTVMRTAPRLGENTVGILQEFGYEEENISELIRLKVAHEYLPGLGSKQTYYFAPDEK